MSRKEKKAREQKISTRQFINTKAVSDYSIVDRVYALMNVLKGVAEIEMLCLNSRENFEENKNFLRKRTEEERKPVVRKLLERDQREVRGLWRGTVDHPGRLGGDCFSPYPFRAFFGMMLMGLKGW